MQNGPIVSFDQLEKEAEEQLKGKLSTSSLSSRNMHTIKAQLKVMCPCKYSSFAGGGHGNFT